MRPDRNELLQTYTEMHPTLEGIASKLEIELTRWMDQQMHVDRIICRAKSINSFMDKTEKKKKDGTYKYAVPLKEIQDKIGGRIVVYYKSDIEPIKIAVSKYLRHIEEQMIVPDDVSKFGYEGYHMVCQIPNTVFPNKDNVVIGDFFELQIKTLYQHAWSQSNHGLGYKPGDGGIKDKEVRLLAFIAAQSWGADKGLMELAEEKLNN